MGDPLEILVQGYSLTLRGAEADKIEVSLAEAPEAIQAQPQQPLEEIEHPGFGEEGKYHNKEQENPLPEGTMLSFALAGQQNSGKTTLFNQLTGANQHVGNFPGVTVDRKDGPIRGHKDTVVTDLPGIYSLSTYTQEELVSRNYIITKPIHESQKQYHGDRELQLRTQYPTLEGGTFFSIFT